MGANCCVSARNHSLPTRTNIGISAHTNIRYSPSWSFGWDNRTHVEDFVDDRQRFSHGNSGNVGSNVKSRVDAETGLSDGGCPFSSLQTSSWKKCPGFEKTIAGTKGGETDVSTGSNSPQEKNDPMESSTKLSVPNHTPPSSSAFRADPSSSRSFSLPSDPTSSRKACSSPGFQLSRQVSDSHIPVLKSFNESNSTEGRQSFVVGTRSSDLSAGGSHRGSSDSWSMRMFSELVASSQKDGCFFYGEHLNSSQGRVTAPNNQQLRSPPPADSRTCGVCSKLLKERTSCRNLELSVVAVLVCGHVYHAECLENVTPDIDIYDPPCPICMCGGKSPIKLVKKAELKARSKISKIAVADVDLDNVSTMEHKKCSDVRGKVPKFGASSSLKSSFGRPFLKRHLSMGSKKMPRSLSENERIRKKGFWARYQWD